MPSLKYFGMKNSAISVNAIGHMVSPAHCSHAGCITLTVAAYQLLRGQVGHHQRTKDNQTAQASASKEVTVFAGLVRSLGF